MSTISSNNKGLSQQSQPSIKAAIAKYRRYWWLFLLSLIVCGGLAVAYLKIKAPVYLVQSSLLVDQDSGLPGTTAPKSATSGASSLLRNFSFLGFGGGSGVDDEVIVMDSHELRSQVVDELKLNRSYIEKKGLFKKIDHYNDSPIEIDAPQALFDTLSISLQFKIKMDKQGKTQITVKKGMFKILAEVKDVTLPVNVNTGWGIYNVHTTSHYTPGKDLKINAYVTGTDIAAENLAKTTTVKVMTKKANAIYLDVEETNVKRGKDLLNTLMRVYNERGMQQKNDKALVTAKFIDDRLAIIYKELTGSEAEIEEFKRKNNIYDPEVQAKAVATKQSAAEQQATALESQYHIISMMRDFVRDPKNTGAYIPFDGGGTAASGFVSAYNQLITERTHLAVSARDNNQVLQDMDKEIATMRVNVLHGLDNSLKALQHQISEANKMEGQSEDAIGSFPSQEREGRTLLRNQTIQNALYTFLLQEREQNQLLLASKTPKGQIVDHAYAGSEPLKPKKGIVLMLALVIGFLIPIALIYVKNMFRTKPGDELDDKAQGKVEGKDSEGKVEDKVGEAS